jgi:hypothetical protein
LEVIKFLIEKASRECPVKKFMVDYHFTVLQCVYLSLEVIEVLIEAYPNAVNVTDTERNLPLHTACLRVATFEVIQLLLDRFVGDKQHHNGLSIADNNECLPIHYYARSQNARAKALQHLLKLYSGGIHVIDGTGRLPLHHARLLFLVLALPYLKLFTFWSNQLLILSSRNVQMEEYRLSTLGVFATETSRSKRTCLNGKTRL